MTLNRHEKYRNIPFCTDDCHSDFYTYANVKDLAGQCETSKEHVKCRTLGILQSHHGKFWLTDINGSGAQTGFKIQVSMVYLKSPPQTTVLPYPAQLFGTTQWKNRLVIFPIILQVLSVPLAIRIKDIMNNITAVHLATTNKESLQDEPA